MTYRELQEKISKLAYHSLDVEVCGFEDGSDVYFWASDLVFDADEKPILTGHFPNKD